MSFMPARISWLFLSGAAVFYPQLSGSNALKVGWRDHFKLPSFNAGWCEATVAGALKLNCGPHLERWVFGTKCLAWNTGRQRRSHCQRYKTCKQPCSDFLPNWIRIYNGHVMLFRISTFFQLMKILITGGVKSGKSRHAEKLILAMTKELSLSILLQRN
ncbi:MAG: hypothetical protein CM1200mP28_14580 [Deltaproteobacteria bacterium]|nr:MAG: hypothetical protein CM1200mP28_14580 [Deltaproteobacteria bacterium]